MRVVILAVLVALFSCAAAHTVNCWGVALNPPEKDVRHAKATMDRAIQNPTSGPGGVIEPSIHSDSHSCGSVYCYKKTSIRWCNDTDGPRTMALQNIADATQVLLSQCTSKFKGKWVTGGVVDHPDHWSLVIQTDDEC